ncbi:MAG: hypothetical protein RLZZ308_250 [Candidatus Parcubacteria bacterium]
MKPRIRIHHTYVLVAFMLCILGSTKSAPAFDSSNSTRHTEEVQTEVLVVPPQPRNKHGRFICTKNRYEQGERQYGVVSWYGNSFHGKPTASGEIFDQNANTLAHLTLPMGTEVLVHNPKNGISVYARVNDCGPFEKGRIADLSRGLAQQLGIMERGIGEVIITVL